MNRKSVLIRFDGQAGDGVLSTGQILARAAARSGYEVLTQSMFSSEVRGGTSTFQLRLGCEPLLSAGERPDIVIALDKESAVRQSRELAEGGLLMHTLDCEPSALGLSPSQEAHGIDWKATATSSGATVRSHNVVAAGFAGALVGIPRDAIETAVSRRFAKNLELAQTNARAAAAGFDSVAKVLNGTGQSRRLATSSGKPFLLLSGNEAVALGALVGGVRFYAGYPITPASEIMEVFAKHLPQLGGHFIQAEDEIAALAMCVGASFGGRPAMTATSGPGLSLMCELIGLAGMAEVPLVIADVQRAGPSTGMPTKDGQGDLNLAVYGTHGDVPRVVLAAQTVAGCFHQAIRAVNIAQKYHVPVLLLSSQAISHSLETVELPDLERLDIHEELLYQSPSDGDFRRYRSTLDGQASLRSIPGTPGGMYRTGGLEHDELGQPCSTPKNRVAMIERRSERLDAILREQSKFESALVPEGNHCPIAIVAWGRAASAAREALTELQQSGLKIGGYFPQLLWPLPIDPLHELLAAGAKILYVCETNSTGQLAQLIRSHLSRALVAHGVEVVSITKDDGNPIACCEIRHQIELHRASIHSELSGGAEMNTVMHTTPCN